MLVLRRDDLGRTEHLLSTHPVTIRLSLQFDWYFFSLWYDLWISLLTVLEFSSLNDQTGVYLDATLAIIDLSANKQCEIP